MQRFDEYKESDQVSSLKACDFKHCTDLIVGSKTADDYKGPNHQYVCDNKLRINRNKVRRLTPMECERLQGYPDGWTLIGEPEEVEVKDYDIEYDEKGNVVSKTFIGTHTEIEYFYIDGEGKKKRCIDSSRYKALGNSIALPFWAHLAKRFVDIGEVQTIGSLFDGIGGFPLVFKQAGAITLWTSEIEPFCEEVVKIRLGKE